MRSDAVRSRIPLHAIFCAFTFLVAELIAKPWAEMGISDDWSYVRTVQILANTGHIVYNGWATAMLGWQLLPGVLFVKLFGFSYTSVRMSTMLFAVLTVFLTQRVFVRCGISERNATLGTLAVSLSPIYMKIAGTFMTDIQGLFGVVLCLYCCIRALQALSDNAACAWLVSAAFSNAIIGSARQVAWLGILVMVPCTLWLLRPIWTQPSRRKIIIVGVLAEVVGLLFMLFCLSWFKHQPYTLSEPILVPINGRHGLIYMSRQLVRAGMEVFFLLLAISVAFLPEVRRWSRTILAVVAVFLTGYMLLALHIAKHLPGSMLEPVLGDWIGPHAWSAGLGLTSEGPVILSVPTRAVLTFITLLATICIGLFLLRLRKAEQGTTPPVPALDRSTSALTWRQVRWLTLPFIAAYFALLIPRSTGNLWDRYLLELNVVVALLLIRLYQDFIHPRLPLATTFGVVLIGLFSMASTHDMYAIYRARVELNDRVAAAGIPRAQLDGGSDYDADVQIHTTGYINEPRLALPVGSYNPNADPFRGGTCDGQMGGDHSTWPDFDPHYGIAFSPDDCAGPTSFAPVYFTRWLPIMRQALYVVRYRPNPMARTPYR